jgi:hypothetical protein
LYFVEDYYYGDRVDAYYSSFAVVRVAVAVVDVVVDVVVDDDDDAAAVVVGIHHSFANLEEDDLCPKKANKI